MTKFSDLIEGSYIWVVWNLNWDKSKPSEYKFYPSEFEIRKSLVLKNQLNVPETYDRGDRWESNIVTISTNYLTIFFNNIEYRRSYDEFYNDKGQMTFTPPYNKWGPHIEVFTEEQDAKDYVIARCEHRMKGIEEQIKELEFEKSLLEKSINKL